MNLLCADPPAMNLTLTTAQVLEINRTLVTTNQLVLLMLLVEALGEPLCGTILGERCRIATCTVESTAKRLIEMGLIERAPQEGSRERFYRATDQGKKLFGEKKLKFI